MGDSGTSGTGPLFATAAATAEWLRERISLFDQRSFLLTVVAIVFLAFKMPRRQRGQLRYSVGMLGCSLVLTLLQLAFHEGTSFHSFLAGCSLFCLLAALGLTLVLLLALVLPLPRIARDLLNLGMFCAVLIGVLYRAGVDPTTLLTSSAVLTAVIGLALRDTLGNLIAGLSFQMQLPFQVGDWIQYDQVPQNIGEITEINWRATKIVTNEEVEIILPNGPLAQATIRNFCRPEKWAMRSVFVRAPFDVSPERIRRIILEAIRDIEGVCRKPAPSVMTSGFTDSGIEYWVRVFTEDFRNRIQVESDVRDYIWYALAREGIVIPTATHAVTVTQAAPPPRVTREEALERRQQHMARLPIFAVLPDPELRRLAASAREQVFAPGETVIHQGDAGNGLYLIEHGEIVVTAREGAGPEVEVARLATGSVFGEMSLLTGEPRTATATAMCECHLLLVDKQAFGPILLGHPELAERICQVLVERQALLRSRLSDSAAEPSTDRKRNFLRRICEFFSLRGIP